MRVEYRIGCSSWTSPSWSGRFYPHHVADGDRLAYYARFFDTVEVDSTYYGPPNPYVVRNWARKTPDGFAFTVKMTRDFLDPKKGVDADGLGKFTEVIRWLGPKLGPVLLQFAPWVKPARATGFLTALLDSLEPSLRYAIELRDAGWFRGETKLRLLRTLRDRRMALAWSYLTYMDVPPEVTTDLLYMRFIGDHETIPAGTHGEIRIDRSKETRLWADRLNQRGGEVPQAFVFFNNHYAGYAPESVNLFRTEVGLPAVPLPPTYHLGGLFEGASARDPDETEGSADPRP